MISAWSLGGAHDLEWEHDGREPEIVEDDDGERDSCYWPNEGDQTKFYPLSSMGA